MRRRLARAASKSLRLADLDHLSSSWPPAATLATLPHAEVALAEPLVAELPSATADSASAAASSGAASAGLAPMELPAAGAAAHGERRADGGVTRAGPASDRELARAASATPIMTVASLAALEQQVEHEVCGQLGIPVNCKTVNPNEIRQNLVLNVRALQRESKRELLASIKRIRRDFQRQEAVLRNEIASLQSALAKVRNGHLCGGCANEPRLMRIVSICGTMARRHRTSRGRSVTGGASWRSRRPRGS